MSRIPAMTAAAILAAATSLSLVGTALAQGDLDCSDFTTRQQAQAVYEQDPRDPHNLDSDNDGRACESLPGKVSSGDGGAAGENTAKKDTGGTTQVKKVPTGAVDTGDGSTSGHEGMGYPVGALVLAIAGGIAVAARRGVPQQR